MMRRALLVVHWNSIDAASSSSAADIDLASLVLLLCRQDWLNLLLLVVSLDGVCI